MIREQLLCWMVHEKGCMYRAQTGVCYCRTQSYRIYLCNPTGGHCDGCRCDDSCVCEEFTPTSDPVLSSVDYLSVEWDGVADVDWEARTPGFVDRDSSVNNVISSTQPKDLMGLLEMFVSPEKLQEDNKWYCSNCKEHVCATKTLSIHSTPPTLLIHLKRFSLQWNEKNDTFIDFPLTGMDMLLVRCAFCTICVCLLIVPVCCTS